MGGIVGRLFREFAVTLSAAILVSLVVSLNTTPMMCARLLRPREEEPKHGRLYHATERAFNSLQSGYERTLDWDRHPERLLPTAGHGPHLSHEPGANLFLQPNQDIRVGGRSGGAQYQYTLQADSTDTLRTWEPKVKSALSEVPSLADINTDAKDKGLDTSLVVNRDTIARLGLNQSLIDATLNDLFGQRQVSTIYNPLNQYHVVMEAARRSGTVRQF
jgi:multidrug efflux pump subunit AcrB